MVSVVTEGRFLGPNLLVQMLVRASNFALNPINPATTIPATSQTDIATAIMHNTDIQELGLLVRVLCETAYHNHMHKTQVGSEANLAVRAHSDVVATWLCTIGDAKPDKQDPLGIIMAAFPYPIPINNFTVSVDGLKRIMVLRDTVGFDGLNDALHGKCFKHETEARNFITRMVITGIAIRAAAIAGIDNEPLLRGVVSNIIELGRNAHLVAGNKTSRMAGTYELLLNDARRAFPQRLRNLKIAVEELTRTPMRGTMRFELPRPTSEPR